MKKLLFLLLIPFILSAQETLFKSTYYDSNGKDHPITWNKSRNAAQFGIGDTTYATGIFSPPFNINNRGEGATGLWGIVIQPDSAGYAAASDADPDTFNFYPEYYLGGSIGWKTGAIMQFHTRYDTTLTGGFADTTSNIIDVAGDGTNYFWQSSPSDSFMIHSFPIQRVRVKAVIVDADKSSFVHYGLKSEIFWDTR